MENLSKSYGFPGDPAVGSEGGGKAPTSGSTAEIPLPLVPAQIFDVFRLWQAAEIFQEREDPGVATTH